MKGKMLRNSKVEVAKNIHMTGKQKKKITCYL